MTNAESVNLCAYDGRAFPLTRGPLTCRPLAGLGAVLRLADWALRRGIVRLAMAAASLG
jgi:hypothetical protein